MYASFFVVALLAPLSTTAAPQHFKSTTINDRAVFSLHQFKYAEMVNKRQAPAKPQPCQPINPAPSEEDTKLRFDKFVDAFLVKKNITAAFEYISQGYINHNPAAQTGFDSAWNILSPIWASQQITVLRTKFQYPQGWLNYRSGFGEVVDRYRWEAGCIVEHWDQGEQFPA